MRPQAKRPPPADAFSRIFAWAIGERPSGPGYPDLNARLVYHLVAHFLDERASEIEQADVGRYIGVRKNTWSLQTKQPYSEDSARDELRYLRKIVDAYAEAHPGLVIKQKWIVIGRYNLRYVHLVHDRDAIKRLLRATSGWEWDPQGSQMQRIPSGARRLFNRRVFAHTGRYVLIASLTGTKEDCARRLRWSKDPAGEVSYVDLDAGTLHRLGPDEPGFPKFKGVEVLMPKLLLRLMRRWHAADMKAGIDLVIHAPDGSAVKSSLKQALRSVSRWAGLSGVSPQSLIDTCAATALERGAPMFGVAMTIGLNPVATRRRYDHFRSDLHEKSLRALDNPVTSGAASPATPSRPSDTRGEGRAA